MFGGQPRLVGLADVRGKSAEGAPVGRLLYRQGNLGIELLDDIADGQAGFEYSVRQPFAELADRAIDELRIFAVASGGVLVILDGLERGAALAAGKGRVTGVEAEDCLLYTSPSPRD